MSGSGGQDRAQRIVRHCITAYAIVGIAIALYFFFLPGYTVAREIGAIQATAEIPAFAWRLERSLTPRIGPWARARVESGRAKALSRDDLSGTEWPLFGS